MGFLTRVKRIVEFKASAALGEFENADQLLDGAIGELNAEVERLRRAVAGVIADEKRLKAEIDELRGKGREWESRAALALKDAREDLAREALLQKHDCDARALALHGKWEEQKRSAEQLKAALRQASEKIADTKRKYAVLAARQASAQTNKAVAEKLSGRGADSSLELMERLSERIRQTEAETDAYLELAGDSMAADLDAQFAALERQRGADAALARMKAELGAGQ